MATSANKRIGILGGTFNPVHNGHLYIAEQAIKKFRLDRLIFVPVYMPPHKKISDRIAIKDRLNMLRLAARKNKKFSISNYEIKQKGKSYSIKTARFFRRKYGSKTEFFFIIGRDSLRGLKKWKDIKELRKIVKFACFPRTKGDISSTEIRRRLKKGDPIDNLVPREVSKYIEENKLYR